MQTTIRHGGGVVIHATPMDTRDFATNNPAGAWPASSLRGEGISIELDARGDLVDYTGPDDVLNEELAAFLEYAIRRGVSILTADIAEY